MKLRRVVTIVIPFRFRILFRTASCERSPRARAAVTRNYPRGAERFRNKGACELIYSHSQDDLADMAAAFHQRMGLCGIGEREGCVDNRLHAARFDERPDIGFNRTGECRLLIIAPWAEC